MHFNHRITFKILLVLLFSLPFIKAQAQELGYINTKTSGFLIGTSYVDENLPGGNKYHPIKFIYKYAVPLLRKIR